MRRRDFVILLAGAMGGRPSAVRAQQKATPVIGWLIVFWASSNLDAIRDQIHQGLSETGFVEGQNIVSEYRWADGHYDRLPALAADLVSRKVDLIITIGGAPAALAAKNATSTIPIVFAGLGDPVGFGLVASLARPGGNLTGFSTLYVELAPKRLELLSEVKPQARVIALLVNPDNRGAESVIGVMREAARAKRVGLEILKASTDGQIEAAFAQLHFDGLVVGPDPFFTSRPKQLAALALRHSVPTIYQYREFAAAGGLISYGVDTAVLFRQAGIYVGKILNGAKPADLPVQQPTRFELIVNLKTAKALDLTVPRSILALADEVVE